MHTNFIPKTVLQTKSFRNFNLNFIGGVILLLFLNLSCRKAEALLPTETFATDPLYEQFFDLKKVEDPEILRLAADLRKIDSASKFLISFVKKNGLPRWDMMDYRTKPVNAGSISLNDTNSPSDSSNSGLFFFLSNIHKMDR